jgi:hypothetical protein
MLKPMPYMTPDNPHRQYLPWVREIEAEQPGRWIAQRKRNGWRRPGYKLGCWTFHSKYETGEEAKAQPPLDLVAELESLGIPDGTAFDMEWMGRRDTEYTKGQNWFEIFDLVYWNKRWQGDVPLKDRLANLKDLLYLCRAKAKMDGKMLDAEHITPRIILMPVVEKNFVEFYEQQKLDPLSEGMVMKRLNSTLLGNGRDNPFWLKIKYREG